MATASGTGLSENKNQECDVTLKIMTVGNTNVGKSSYLSRFIDNKFSPGFSSTVGVDLKQKVLRLKDGRIAQLQLWDTAGQERYRSLTVPYIRGAMGFILMFDLTDESSFYAVRDWAEQIGQWSWEHAQILLVANKVDLWRMRQIEERQGRDLAAALKCGYFETSAKDNTNVNESLHALVDSICLKMADNKLTDPTTFKTSVDLDPRMAPYPKSCC